MKRRTISSKPEDLESFRLIEGRRHSIDGKSTAVEKHKNVMARNLRIFNGTPLQYSCLENPMDGGAWKAAVHGVAEGWTQLSNFTFTFHFHDWRRKWQPTPVFLPGESQGRGSLVGCRLWGRTESDTTEAT